MDWRTGYWIAQTVWMEWIFRTDARDYGKIYNQFKKSLALQNLVSLKEAWATFWALSNQELSFITDSSTALDYWASESEYKTELEKIQRLLLKAYPQISWQVQQKEDTSSGSSSWWGSTLKQQTSNIINNKLNYSVIEQ